jgi:DNA integrity scanning protein DisA with diadenylate cyclase activity
VFDVIWQQYNDLLLFFLDLLFASLFVVLLLGRIGESRTLWLLRGYLFLVSLAWLIQRFVPLPLTSKLLDALVLACSLALAILWQGELRRLMELLGTGRLDRQEPGPIGFWLGPCGHGGGRTPVPGTPGGPGGS